MTPASLHFKNHAIFRPSVRMTCMPSRSSLTSSCVLPCTMFQYREEMTGISAQVRYLFSWSKVAVVPDLDPKLNYL